MRERRIARPPGAGEHPNAGPAPLPAHALATFAARYGLSVEAIAARLGLEATELLAFDRGGGPGWLRLALVGVAVERGERADALAWLLEVRARDAPAAGAPSDAPEDRLG